MVEGLERREVGVATIFGIQVGRGGSYGREGRGGGRIKRLGKVESCNVRVKVERRSIAHIVRVETKWGDRMKGKVGVLEVKS